MKVANAYSPPLPVTSGVPQGSVLGPLLFILFLSDLPTVFYSTPSVSFRLFADDIKIYSSFSDKNARLLHVSMSSALSSISTYFDRMQLKLSSHKCVVLHLGKRNPRMQYSLGNHILSVVDTVRDLGVIVDSNLSFHEHCTSVHKKGLGLVFSLFRSFQCTNRSALIHAYRTYILPVLEYASPVWNPHLKKHIRSIERVQHVFTRLLYYRCSLAPYQFLPSYAERVAVLNISTLFTRRLVNDITFARNLLSGKIDQPISHFYLFKPTNGRTSSFSIDCNKSNTNILFHSFAHRTVRFLRLLQSHSLPLDTLTRTKLDSLVDLPSILHVNVPTLWFIPSPFRILSDPSFTWFLLGVRSNTMQCQSLPGLLPCSRWLPSGQRVIPQELPLFPHSPLLPHHSHSISFHSSLVSFPMLIISRPIFAIYRFIHTTLLPSFSCCHSMLLH